LNYIPVVEDDPVAGDIPAASRRILEEKVAGDDGGLVLT